ncbi:MAG: ATP synthase subunit I [Pseudomonadota bacterium]|nr:ATP synthase subunit I [Pseudomonadota bacterium]
MPELLPLAGAVAAGLLLGATFFGGLWWTVNRGISSSQPALWFFGSMVLRTGVVLAGFYLVGHGRWDRLALCLLGFVLARIAINRLTRPASDLRNARAPDARHAS